MRGAGQEAAMASIAAPRLGWHRIEWAVLGACQRPITARTRSRENEIPQMVGRLGRKAPIVVVVVVVACDNIATLALHSVLRHSEARQPNTYSGFPAVSPHNSPTSRLRQG
ncbi:unnamed protein product [Lota lota]